MNTGSPDSRPAVASGFERKILRSNRVTVECIPELGGRICSLISEKTQREWMWRQKGDPALFRPTDPSDFTSGTYAGLDECLPTVGKSHWTDGRSIADHGDIWAKRWAVISHSDDMLDLTVDSPTWGLRLRRRIVLSDTVLRFSYLLENTSQHEAPALWAMHPLFTFQPGDSLELPESVRTLRVENADLAVQAHLHEPGGQITYPEISPGTRLDRLSLPDSDHGFLKCFSGPLEMADGWASLVNAGSGDRLTIRWDTLAAPYMGLWLTRGGYRGWHHVAIEPSNAGFDRIDDALRAQQASARITLPPRGLRRWWVEWEVA